MIVWKVGKICAAVSTAFWVEFKSVWNASETAKPRVRISHSGCSLRLFRNHYWAWTHAHLSVPRFSGSGFWFCPERRAFSYRWLKVYGLISYLNYCKLRGHKSLKWLWKFAFDCWQNVAFKRLQNGSASQQQKCLTACLLHWPASVLHSASDQFVATVTISSPIQEIATYVYLAFLRSFSQFSRCDRFQKTPFKMFSVHTKTG